MKYYGLDTEVPLGRCRLMATNEDHKELETFEDALNFLLQTKYRGAKMFTFNMKYDVNVLLKLTGDRKFITDLLECPTWKGLEYKDTEVFLKYIPGKFLKVSRGKNAVTVTDMAIFHNGMSLEKASQKFLSEGKHPISAKRIGQEPGYYEANKQAIIDYCKQDAKLTLDLGLRIKDLIEKCEMPRGRLSFRNPISSAKVAELYEKDLGKTAYPAIKVGKTLPLHHAFAQGSFHGGMFQTFKRGFFDCNLYHYDINSAYPSVMKDLPHWANGRFEEVKSVGSGEYGWYACKFNCEWMPFNDTTHPYILEQEIEEDGSTKLKVTTDIVNPKRKIYPIGERIQIVTKVEYEWMLRNNYPCEFINGMEWFKTKDEYENPFFWIPDVYKTRKAMAKTGDERQYALKIVLNGMYGKTAQFKHGIGALTNFFYASYITAVTRLQVAEVARKYPENTIEIATDSVLLDRKADIPLTDKLGDWGLDEYRRGILIGSGMHQLYYKHEKDIEKNKSEFVTHARGLTELRTWDMESDLYRWKSKDYVCFPKERPVQLREMLTHTKVYKFEDLAKFVKVQKRLHVNTDKKRKWVREYTGILDFINSEIQTSGALEVKDGNII